MSESPADREAVAAALPLYDIEGELGRGSWGVVLAARHRQLGRDVAIKQLPRAFGAVAAVRTRFISEARVLASFEHPHIVPIYDFIEHEDLCMLVMERLTGGTVASRARAGGFTPATACALTLAVCAGLHYAHQRGVLHRDVKPDNLMFSSSGVLKVADFGIAKVVGGAATVATRAGDVLGTPAYMAPEQAQGGELSPATDIYALGTVLYELLSGHLPFSADSDPIAMLYRHVHEEPVSLALVAPNLPGQLVAVTARALEKDPSRRYPDAEHMAIAVAEAAALAWGERWLPTTGTTVTATGPVLSAAVGHRNVSLAETIAPDAPVRHVGGTGASTPTPADLVPVNVLPGMAPPDARSTLDAPTPTPPPRPAPPAQSEPPPTVAPPPPSEPPPTVAPPWPSPPAPAPPAAPAPTGAMSRSGRRFPVVPVAIVALLVVVAAVLVATRGGGTKSKSTAVVTSSALKPGDWRGVRDAPTARQQLGVAVADSSIWVLGGITEATSTALVERYNPSADTWTKGPDLPLPLHHEMAVAYKGRVVVIGGWVPANGSLTGSTSDRVFELHGSSWKELAKLPHARAAGGAAVVGDKIVVFGGQAAGKLVPETDVYDGKAWAPGPPLPTPRDHLAAASDGKDVYALGGRDLSADKNLATVERFDPAVGKWDAVAPLPTPRGDVSAATIAGRILVLGGETPTTVLNTVEAFDLQSQSWSVAPTLPTPRHGLGVAAVGSSLYAIDGALRPGHSASAPTAEALPFTAGASGTSQWQKVHDAPTPRQQAATAVDDGKVWVIGGLTRDGATAKVEAYDPAIDTWNAGPDLPQPLHDAMAVAYRGEVVVIGGWLSDAGHIEAHESDKVYALRDGGWAELQPLRARRAAGAAVVIGQRVIVVGGTTDGGLTPETEIYDGHGWTLGADMPVPRKQLAAATDGHYLFAAGGRGGPARANMSTLQRYDPDQRDWKPLPEMPTPRGAIGAAVVKGRLFVVGGETIPSVLNTVEVFDLRGSSWSRGSPLGTARHSPSVAALGDSLFALDGGLAPGGGQPSTVSEVLRL